MSKSPKRIKITATKTDPGPNVTQELREQINQLIGVGQMLEQMIRGHMLWHEAQQYEKKADPVGDGQRTSARTTQAY